MKLKLGIVFGGRSGEHEVSLMSARSVLNVLDQDLYEVHEIGITHTGVWLSGEHVSDCFEKGDFTSLYQVVLVNEKGNPSLFKRQIVENNEELIPLTTLDVIFPILHGTFGEDGTFQGQMEMNDVAYVGAGVLGSSVGMDKGVFKEVMRANHLPIVKSLVCTRRDVENDVDRIISNAENMSTYPLFVKPANLGSSVGITKCKNRSDLLEGLMDAARYDRRILIEEGINAREIEVSVLGNEDLQVSVPGEIVPSDEFYSYHAKYIDGKSELIIPAPISPESKQQVQEMALTAYRAIDCAGMARVDFLLDKISGKIFINEVNTIPGFTSISMYPKLWEASGLPYKKLIDRLIELALERKKDRDMNQRQFDRS